MFDEILEPVYRAPAVIDALNAPTARYTGRPRGEQFTDVVGDVTTPDGLYRPDV